MFMQNLQSNSYYDQGGLNKTSLSSPNKVVVMDPFKYKDIFTFTVKGYIYSSLSN